MAKTKKRNVLNMLSSLFKGYKEKENKDQSYFDLPENGGFEYGDAVRFSQLISSEDESETEKLIQPFPVDRLAGYLIFEEMANDPTINSALKMHVANALSAKTDTGEMLFISSTKEAEEGDQENDVVTDLRNTIGVWMNDNAEKLAFQASKFGVTYVRPYIKQGRGIVHNRFDHYTHPAHVRSYERAGILCGYTSKYQRSLEKKGMVELLPPWTFIPFKIPKWESNPYLREPVRVNHYQFDIGDDDYWNEEPIESQDYGSSILRPAYDPWIDLNEAILSLNSARHNAAKRDRFIAIQVGKKNPTLAARYYDTILKALKKKFNLSARRSARRGHIATIDNHIIPVTADGSGQVTIQTEQTDVNVSHIEDVDLHISRMASALGVDKSLLGFTQDMSSGLGEGGWFIQSMIAAIKANLIRRALRTGFEMMCELHVLMKWGKVYTQSDKPWRIEFNSLNNVLEREESTARDSRINFATATVTLMQMLDPELNKFDFKNLSNWIFTDVLRVSEDTFKNILSAAKEGDEEKIEEVLDSVRDDEARNNLKTIIYGCIAELMGDNDE